MSANITVYLQGGPADGTVSDLSVAFNPDQTPCVPDELDVDDLDPSGKVVGRLLYSGRQAMAHPENAYIYHYDSRLDD